MRFLTVACVTILFVFSAFGQVKKPDAPPFKLPFSNSQQAVVITTKTLDATAGKGHLFERNNARSEWKQVGDAFPVVVGRNGLAWGEVLSSELSMTKLKTEGDGNAPAGLFPLTSAFGTATKPVAVEMPYIKLDRYTECVDDVRSSFYNRIVNRMQVGNLDWKSSEKMLEVSPEYDLGIFVAYNSYPVETARGSCIFLHVWKAPTVPTSGCTAMDRLNLERIVGWLSPSKTPYLVQMTEDLYDKRRKSWKLPKLR